MKLNRGVLGRLIKLKSKYLWIGILPAALIMVGAVFWSNQGGTKNTEVQYEQVKVKRDDIIVGLDSDGSIEFSKVNLRFGVKGTISEIKVDEGDEVNKGDVIAKLNSQDYQDQYELAAAKLQDAQEQKELNLKKLETELQRLRYEFKEMESIPDAYPANEIELKKRELENKELEYQQVLDNQLDQYKLQLKMAEENLEDTILYAPVSGVVLGLSKKAGESITDEQDFAAIHANKEIKAVTKVIEYDIGQINIGQKVYVAVEALPDKKFEAEVTKIGLLPTDDSSGLVNYVVEVTIKNPSPQLKDGMTCVVSFIRKEVQDCLVIPYNAVKNITGKQVVTVIDKSGKKVERQIKTGFTDGISVEVVEGLKVNETIVYPKSR